MREIPDSIRSDIADLLGLVRSLADGEYGIALGGSYAKGTADADSDLDLYLFSKRIRPREERQRLVAAYSPDITALVCWDVGDPVTQCGTDFRYCGRLVETWTRSIDAIDAVIEECRQGIVKRNLVTWTTTGFYNHCCLSDIQVMIPLEDPAGIISLWKSLIAVYPPKLKQAIIEQHLGAARFWPWNPHYQSAVERADVIYVTGIVQQVVHNVIQVLFALNETYFPGDKNLRRSTDHFQLAPPRLGERLDSLLWPDYPPTPEMLHRQQADLCDLVQETMKLVSVHT